jgi:hypothetical protein
MTTCEKILDRDLALLEHDELLEAAKSLRDTYNHCLSENAKLQEELKRLQADHSSQRVLSFPSSTPSFELRPSWIRAELDCPGDMSWFCFRQRSKYPTVIVYDSSQSSLEARSRETLKGELNLICCNGGWLTLAIDERAGIYSRLPSRTSDAIHVFVECATTAASGSTRKFRIATKEQTPPGFVRDCTIHLKRLSWRTRVNVWMGRIKWLYILRDPESRANSPSDQQQLEK